MRRSVVWSGLIFGFWGGLVATSWTVVQLRSGHPVDPILAVVVSAAWGTVIGGITGAIAGGTPSRATLALGFGALAGAVGGIAGLAFAVHALGHDLLDGNPNVHLASALAGAAAGWAAGTGAGVVAGRDAPALTPRQICVARSAAIGLLGVGVLFAVAVGRGLEPIGAARRAVGWSQTMLLADALLVAVTIAIVAGLRPRDDAQTPPVGARAAGRSGLVLACGLLVTLAACAPGSELDRSIDRLGGVVARTAVDLAGAGEAYAERTGRIPADADTLVRRGARVPPGIQVNGLFRVPLGFCVEVGTALDGPVGFPPLSSEAVWFVRTRDGGLRAKGFTGGRGGCGSLLASGR